MVARARNSIRGDRRRCQYHRQCLHALPVAAQARQCDFAVRGQVPVVGLDGQARIGRREGLGVPPGREQALLFGPLFLPGAHCLWIVVEFGEIDDEAGPLLSRYQAEPGSSRIWARRASAATPTRFQPLSRSTCASTRVCPDAVTVTAPSGHP